MDRVVAVWHGTLLFDEEDPNKNAYIRRTDYIASDNGEVVLNERLFDDIPDTAIVYITLLRGNLENIMVDDYSYKIGGESHVKLPIILVRNIKQKNS